ERPVTQLHHAGALTDVPGRYAYDFVNADMLRDQISVQGADLVAKGGARYRVLYLGGDSQRMTLPVLRRIAALAEAGATVVGRAPVASPSLADDPKAFAALVKRLWSGAPVTAVGRGKVVASADAETALSSAGVGADFSYDAAPDRQVMFLHRRLPDGDVYFLSNRRDRPETFEARFRVAGKAPEIWRAETGTSGPVSYRIAGGETRVPLQLQPHDAVFVVFRKPARAPAVTVPARNWRPVQTLAGGWDVTFQPGRSAPESVRLVRLASLSESADPGVKYFSGVATYRTTFQAAAPKPGQAVMLDLGQIGDIAEVSLNGVAVGTAWHAPYRLDVAKALRPGENRLEVKVADLWVNRLIGDQQPDAKKITFTTAPTYKADAPLRPSGLMGPVQLLAAP
ncbi:MAG TPA: glycosyl hydrolase, partial [Phenylobacterium sp.]